MSLVVRKNSLNLGDRIKLSGGYDYDPSWLKGGNGYFATVIDFFDNEIKGREGDERLCVSIEFEKDIEYKGLSGKYGFILGRYEGQRWDEEGTVHVHISNMHIKQNSDITDENSVWAESHADYKVIKS